MPDGWILPVTFGLFSSSPDGPTSNKLDVKACQELLNQLKALNREHTDRTGRQYMEESEIKHDVKQALYQFSTARMFTDKFVPIRGCHIPLVYLN